MHTCEHTYKHMTKHRNKQACLLFPLQLTGVINVGRIVDERLRRRVSGNERKGKANRQTGKQAGQVKDRTGQIRKTKQIEVQNTSKVISKTQAKTQDKKK